MTPPFTIALRIPVGRAGLAALVDPEDFDRLSAFSWEAHAGPSGIIYARLMVPVGPSGTRTRMHRMIMEPPPGLVVDHANGDGLDNRRANLRICTISQNAANAPRRRNARCPFKGVQLTESGRWQARIEIGGRARSLGTYSSPEQAARAYDAAAVAHYGEFARPNLPSLASRAFSEAC